MATLQEIQKRAATLSEARDKLSALMLTLQANIDTVKNGAMSDIKRVSRQIAKEHAELADLIKANPELFTKPRSYVVDGIKFGMQASSGSLEWEDDAKVCTRIKRLAEAGEISPDQVELLIKTTEKPVASVLAQLEPGLRKRLGVTVEGDGDQPLIKSVDSTVEKAVNNLINAAIKEAQAEGA